MSLILYAPVNRLKDWETALNLYEDLRNAGLQLTDTMVTSLLSAVGRSGKLDRLHKVHLRTVKLVHVSVICLLDMMFGFLTGHRSEAARQVRVCQVLIY
jgi:hypothetical protein